MISKIEKDKLAVQFHKLNGIDYQHVWDFQRILHDGIKADKLKQLKSPHTKDIAICLNHVVFCEHKHVITLGKSGKMEHLNASFSDLERENIEFFKINRGGDITYHGPGQITGYLIFDLELLYRDVHLFVRNIEEVIIRFLSLYNIKGERLKEYTGVWVQRDGVFRKICAIGVHLSRWVSMHGFALNINTDLSYFEKIVPCGIDEENMSLTSLSIECNQSLQPEDVQEQLLEILLDVFNAEILKFD